MTFAVLADIHSNRIALEACVKEARKRHAEAFLFLGDYLGELAFPERTLEALEALSRQFPCTFIRGNKEDYWIDRFHGRNEDWVWEAGKSGSGMLKYVYDRLTPAQIEAFGKMPVSMTLRFPGFPDFVICHGSPWHTDESLREDLAEAPVRRLETELTLCGHFHIQSLYIREGKRVVNPGAVGMPIGSGGRTQFMMLSGHDGKWETEFLTLPYDRERVIREMDEEKLYEQAPGWYRVTKAFLRGGRITHRMVLDRAHELYAQSTGIRDWKSIPEAYWNLAMKELNVPE